jgi:hypothetical protein
MSLRYGETTGPTRAGLRAGHGGKRTRGLGLMLVTLLAGCAEPEAADRDSGFVDGQIAFEQASAQAGMAPGDQQQDGAQQALQGLLQIRQEQCQSGNQLACQALPEFPGHSRQLAQSGQACQSGDREACAAYRNLAERIFTAYSESAAVMRNGAAAMAQMDAWRAQMNRNADASQANLRAQGAAGQAAHEARQQSYEAMNQAWQSGQESSDRTQGRTIDSIYGGTTMDGGGVQTRVPYGEMGYTDGYGNVVTVPQGGSGPDGWEPMRETYAVPD